MTYYGPNDDLSFIPLTVEEERDLFTRYYAGGADALEARDKIVQCHLKLAAKIGLSLVKGALKEEDAISAANAGLMQALESRRFDPAHGVRFGSYLRSYIRGQIFKAFRVLRPRGEMLESDRPMTGLPDAEDNDIAMSGRVGVDSFNEGPWVGGVEFHLNRNHPFEESQTRVECKQLFAKAFAQLSEVERAAVTGVYLEGRKLADVGRKLDQPRTREGMRKAHNRAMQKLREFCEPFRNDFSASLSA